MTVTPSITNTITSANQVVCAGETISQITGAVSGGNPDEVSYQWEESANGTSGWGDAPGASKALNYTPEAEVVTTSKTTYYRRKVVSDNCTSYSEPVSVRIVAMPLAVITDGANDYFCPPASATLTARTGAGYRYTWYKVVEGGDDEQVGADQNTYTTNVEGYYYVVVKGENDCTSTSSVTRVQSTILNTNIISGEQTICYNTVPATLQGEESTSDLGEVTYEWQFSTDGTSFSRISSSNVQNLTVRTALTSDHWYRRIARVGSGCSITSDPVKVTVKPLLRVTNLASATSGLCTGIAFTFNPEGSEGSSSFAWSRAEIAGISNTAANSTGDIDEVLVNTTSAPINVTYVYITSDGEGCSGPAQNLVVRVNPTPVLNSSLAPPAICGGTEFDYAATSATTGTTFSWERKPASGITTSAPASGTGARVEHVLTNTTPNPIDVTYTYTLTANGCSNTQDVVVRVNPRPQLSTTLTPAAICSGATFSYAPDSDTEEASFVWTRIAPASITGGTTSGTGSISQALTNTSVNPVNVIYRFTTSANSCAGTSQDVVVTVNPSPKLNSQLTANVCSGSTFSYAPTSATEGATFSWSRAASGGNAASSGPGNISEVLTNTTTAPITVTYEITTRANGCDGAPQNLVVTINPRPVLNSLLTATVCSGSAFSYTPTSATTGATYTWTRAAVNGISNAAVTTPSSGSISETLVNTTANPIDVTYVYTTTANVCAGPTQELVVTVNPRPQLSSTLTPDAICSGIPFSYTPQSTTIGATFSWTRAAVANISNTAVTTAVAGGINETLINTGTAPVTVTYKYTTTYAANGSSCSGNVQDVEVVVNPSPKLNSSLTASVCSGTPFSYTPTSATTGTTYTWERLPATGITSDGLVTGSGVINQTLTNTTSNSINVTYRITSRANSCTGLTEDVVVRVNPKPVATFVGKIGTAEVGSIIYSDGGNVVFSSTGVAGGSFSVVSPAGLEGFSTSGSTATLNPCTALGTATSKQVTIRYTVSQGTGINQCGNFEDITYTLRRSNYTVIILADPYPTCRGQITEYTAYVYKDATRVIYPYLADANGIAVDENGNRLGDQTLPITNPDYPFPNRESMPDILYDNAWRYFQPKVEGGTLMPATNFNYQWTKNRTNFFGANSPTIQNAGLSSLDYYAVEVTSKSSGCAQPITSKMTNRMYTSATVNYEVALTTDKAIICQGEGIMMTADLNDAFSFWGDISLTLYWMLDRGGVTSQLGQTVYKSGDNIQFPTSGPTGGFLDGDKVFVEFSSALDQYNNANKCARGFITNIVPITVVGEQVMNGGGAYCAGGTGIPIGLNGSQQGVIYQLKRDGVTVGSPVTGTGSAIGFGNQTVGGNYTVEAIARTGTSACLTYGPVNVYVTPLPIVQTLTTVNNGEYCAGGAGVPITLSNSQNNVKYQLRRTVNGTTTNVGLEVIGSDGQPIPFGNQTEAGVYSVLATTLPATGTIAACPQTMGNVTVIVNQLPTVTVNSPTICEGSTATITAVPAGGTGPYTYTWTVPAGFTNPGNVASFPTTVPGTYTVRIGDSKSCASTAAATSTVIVNELPTVTVNNPTVCAGTAATVTASPVDGVGPYRYTWTVPAGATNPGNVASFQTTTAGQYTVRIQDSQSCSSSEVATSTVTVNPIIGVTGRILIFDETGAQIEDESKMEFGMKYTFKVESNMIDLEGADIASIKWWMGDGTTEGWEMVEQGVTEFTMKEPMGALRVSIRCDIPAKEGTCFALDASNIFSLATEPIIPLPVELLYFNATKRGNDVVLDWATASELDNKGFEVQVSSDAKNFRVLGFVESKVNTTSLKQLYTYVDKENGKQGVRYYRLKQVDLDGKSEIFNIRAVHFDEVSANKVKAYPNPFHSEVELSIDAELDGELQITVTTATGQQLLQRSVQVAKGTNIEKLTLDPNLPRGVYIISTRMGDFNSHFKLLKQ
ncbi:T9SS type A sorting domain-containing protein [Pontibacter sp. BT731]|uniref:PKD-like domain-containing protein n=1 Tax=Pontibacter coccineus TaxID=3063328 RepID=UPI0026E2A616|nr:PKD-like domain-containing protein [Pontibacter sp. BT731]MDO6389867.1 T9SS type A sorting domain-containing protein [Pontibacter sp. BT731]